MVLNLLFSRDLRAVATKFGLPADGNKQELIAEIQSALAGPAPKQRRAKAPARRAKPAPQRRQRTKPKKSLQLELYQPSTRGHRKLTDAKLRWYDYIVVSSSGGKDSQAMLDVVARRAERLGILDRVIVLHCDLGECEWPDTKEVAEAQATFYGLPFVVVSRIGTTSKGDVRSAPIPLYERGEARGDLLDQVVRRWRQLEAEPDPKKAAAPPWPGRSGRWCTSDFKRGPARKFITALAAEWHQQHPDKRRAARILDAWGIRADESPKRRKRLEALEERGQAVEHIRSTSNVHHDVWNPIGWWNEDDVWTRIRQAGTVHHPAYDLGMPRLSCVFCVFARRDALLIAGYHNPELLQRYVEVEQLVGRPFQADLALTDLQADLEAGELPPEVAESWEA